MKNNRKDVEVKIVKDDGSEQTVNIYIIRPSNSTVQNADRYRAKIWNKCISDGVLTKKELAKFLKERKIWDEEKEKEESNIIKSLQEIERKLYLGEGLDKKKLKISDGVQMALEMRLLRLQLRELISEKLALEENSAESLSDNARFDYLVSDCTFYSNGEKVYRDVDDYNSKSSDEIAYAAASALAQMIYQIDSKLEESLPENKWLKSFNLVDENLSLVNKEGNLVDTQGRRIDKNGNYINEKGEKVDSAGNLLDENGNYIIQVEYEPDDVQKTEKKKRAAQPS
jgi:hypothetical protein